MFFSDTMAQLLGVDGEDLLDYPGWRSYRADGTIVDPRDAPGTRALRLRRSLPEERMGYAYRDGPVIWVLGTAEYIADGRAIVRWRRAS